MVDIPYDNVTLDFDNYFLGLGMWTPDWTYIHGDEYFMYDHRLALNYIRNNSIPKYDWKPNFDTSYRGSSQKCLTIDIPYIHSKKVWTFGAVFDSSIFPNSTRPGYYEFGVKVHYPGQLLRHQMQKYVWKERGSNSSRYLTMRFKIQKLEVIKHRETGKQPCNYNWMNDDEIMMLEKIERIGCTPSFLQIKTDFPVCNTQKQLKMFNIFNKSHYDPPCKSIQKILYSYEEYDILEDWTEEWLNEVNNIFEVMLEFTDATYMEIEQVRDYGLQDVVGDIGGYLGLFLGFALLQIPEVLFTLICWIEDLIHEKQRKIEPKSSEIKHVSTNSIGENNQGNIEIEKIKQELRDIRGKLLAHQIDLEDMKT